jgi:hypothetical protein
MNNLEIKYIQAVNVNNMFNGPFLELCILGGIGVMWYASCLLPIPTLFIMCLFWYPCEDRTSLRHIPAYLVILAIWCGVWGISAARPHIFGTYAFLLPTTLITSILLSAMLSVPPPQPQEEEE